MLMKQEELKDGYGATGATGTILLKNLAHQACPQQLPEVMQALFLLVAWLSNFGERKLRIKLHHQL
jgi:hypothetical protein